MKSVTELSLEYDKWSDEYLKLRDAKSDGCMVGKSISEIVEYDNKILEAGNEARKHREDMLKVQQLVYFLRDCRDDYLEVLEEKARDGELEGSWWNEEKLRDVRETLETLIIDLM